MPREQQLALENHAKSAILASAGSTLSSGSRRLNLCLTRMGLGLKTTGRSFAFPALGTAIQGAPFQAIL
ncbi:MAG: hypothetical protein WB713_08950, partial [Methyloceanibacter sp.]